MKKIGKVLLLGLCAVLLVTASVLGTMAYLTDTKTVTNTFTVSDITITLTETKEDFKMIPGYTIDKDPQVTVETGSEPCWLFVELEAGNKFNDYMTYMVDEGWTQGNGTDVPQNVYYRKIDTAEMGTPYSILENDQVTVKETVTKEMMAEAKDNEPTLTVTAYACQLKKDNTNEFSFAEAWNVLNPSPAP